MGLIIALAIISLALSVLIAWHFEELKAGRRKGIWDFVIFVLEGIVVGLFILLFNSVSSFLMNLVLWFFMSLGFLTCLLYVGRALLWLARHVHLRTKKAKKAKKEEYFKYYFTSSENFVGKK